MKIKPIKIGNKVVGEEYPCYIIAEIGSNFDGSITKAKKLIKLAKESGSDAAKFQSFRVDELISKKGFEKKGIRRERGEKSVWQLVKDSELPRNWHKELNDYAKKIGIHFFTSVWDFEAIDLLQELNAPAIKIGSGDLTNLELLKYASSKRKPILIATGMSTLNEVRDAVDAIRSTGNDKIILMHSVIQYPCPLEKVNLRVLNTLKQRFKLNVGYSDHSLGPLAPLSSVALGASVIEKHFTINPKLKGLDHRHAMDPRSFGQMVQDIRILEKALGDGIKKIEPNENETRITMRRGIWTIKNVKIGERFTQKNIKALRPALGISASKYRFVLGKRARKKLGAYEPIIRNCF